MSNNNSENMGSGMTYFFNHLMKEFKKKHKNYVTVIDYAGKDSGYTNTSKALNNKG